MNLESNLQGKGIGGFDQSEASIWAYFGPKWAQLASKHDGKDRWYLEALGIAADGKWDECLAAWLELAGDQWNTPAGRDIIWRSRAIKTPSYLAKILLDEKLPQEQQPRYFRAFDFLDGPEKDKALESLLGL